MQNNSHSQRLALHQSFITDRALCFSAKTSASSVVNYVVRLCSILIIAIMFVPRTSSQTPTPTPDDRGLGIQTNQQPSAQSGPAQAKEAKPELVLQTGYSNFFGATRLAFSPDGRLLATATFRTNTIKLWETATGRELRDLSTGGQNTTSLSPVFAFSPDSRLLAGAGSSNSVKVWDIATGREVQTLTGGQNSFVGAFGISFMAFSADGKKLVTLSDAIRVWDTNSWNALTTVQITEVNASSSRP